MRDGGGEVCERWRGWTVVFTNSYAIARHCMQGNQWINYSIHNKLVVCPVWILDCPPCIINHIIIPII